MRQGLTNAVATITIDKSDVFIKHLASRLASLKHSGCPVGHELTASEIRDALSPYLESLLGGYESNLVDVLKFFPNSPAKGYPVAPVTRADVIVNTKKLKAVSRVTVRGPDGQLPQHILYLLELGMDLEQIKRITSRFPAFAYLSLDGKIKPVVEFLLSLGLSKSDILIIVTKRPQFCGFNLQENIIPTMKFLENLGVDKKQWAKVIYQCPSILTCSRQKLEAIIDFLYQMGLSTEGIGKTISRFPHIASYSLESNLHPTAEYFQSLGVQVDVILLRWPQAFGLSIEGKLMPVTEFFLEKGYSEDEVGLMVSRFGALFTYNLSKNLLPKWEFFLTMNYSKEELVKFPQYFSYSLEGRTKPRYTIVQESGVKFLLGHMLTLSDHNFNETLKKKMKKQGLSLLN